MNAILYNGIIHPQHRFRVRPSAVAVTGNRIAEVSHDLHALGRQFPGYDRIDLKGRAILPGFVDSHTHFYFWTISLETVHLDGTASFEEALKKISAFSGGRRADEWILGDGWSADRWNPYHLPTASELDAITGGRPAALFSKDQHILWVNSAALKLAGITKNYPDPPGGKIDRDPMTGIPTGILRETPGYFPVIKLISRMDQKRVHAVWKTASQIAYSRGVTGFHSMDGPEGYEFFKSLNSSGKLGFRADYYFPVKMLGDLITRGIKSGDGDQTLRIGGVKIFADGSLGAQTALMKKPYRGSRENHGVEVTEVDAMTKSIEMASANGLACAIHAIGDQAVANVLTAFENGNRAPNLRHRIEHLQIIAPSDRPRLKRLGLIASMQPSHCPSDRRLVADYWGTRGKDAYIFKTLLREGNPLTFGSDCPIEPLDPLAGIHAAVNRNGIEERGGRFYPEQSLTIREAIAGFTSGPAYASGREDLSGKIAPGYQADMVILDRDPAALPPSKVTEAKVDGTIFDGEFVFRSDNFVV